MHKLRLITFTVTFFTLCSLYLSGCSQLTINLPAIADSQKRHPGQVVWRDLLTHDMKATKQFYSGLFGWTFTEIPNAFGASAYHLISFEGQTIGGAVDTAGLKKGQELSQWVSVFSSTDLAASVKSVTALGGSIEGGPQSVGDRGQLAVVRDSQGAVFALLQTAKGDPVKTPTKAGYFLWQELWNTDGDGQFYTTLFGAQAQTSKLGSAHFTYFTVREQPAFSVTRSPIEGLAPTWVTYVHVDDVQATVKKAQALGGVIAVAPQRNPIGGELAVILDPSGAGFIVQTWQANQDKGANK
ncbi:VOC family protein [Simiduia curdlanivorans]|uniref:VOC family protein n=1 Tax=Simiduia curdlanivorans TaxID=1492769 RepID=A0ABV8V6H1_9GAMM|nr:VOC family protein [Simiduia curdlanivorans]MDN3640695.1 VOC family protein [Simiduia curdlanivorans]